MSIMNLVRSKSIVYAYKQDYTLNSIDSCAKAMARRGCFVRGTAFTDDILVLAGGISRKTERAQTQGKSPRIDIGLR